MLCRFELLYYGEEGIEAIKKLLLDAKEKVNQEAELKVELKLVAPPLYEITTTTTSKSLGTKVLDGALKTVQALSSSDTDFKFNVALNPESVGGDQNTEDIETIINRNKNQDDDDSSNLGEEDNDEGMNVDDDEEEKKLAE